MKESNGLFCRLYRPIGAALLLLAILALLLSRSCSAPAAPAVVVPTIEATLAPLATVAVPTVALPAAPKLNLPALPDFSPDGVKLSGTGEPGSTVELWDGDIKIGTAKVGADGVWSLVGKLSEGAHKLGVRAVDAAGKTLSEAQALDITVPKVEIALPKLNLPALPDFSPDGVKLSGTGKPGSTVQIWDANTKVGEVTVGADGVWSLLAKLAEGSHKMIVRTVDAAGKTLNEAPAIGVSVPGAATATPAPTAVATAVATPAPTVKAPAVPKLNLPAAPDFSAAGVKLSGTGEPGSTVEIWDGATKVGTATVGADGVWSLTAKLAEGAHKLVVRTVDAAGKTLNEAPAVDVSVPKATPAKDDLAAAGEAYIVKQGDWLSALAQQFYGDATLYTRIIEGTNAKAAVDSTFAKITNPNLIEVGQKLWIPPKPAG